MCGRYVISVDPAELMDAFGLTSSDAPEGAAPRYNIAPTQLAPVTFNDSPKALSVAQWGLIPSWSNDASIGSRMINARAETLAEKPSFRTPLRKRRCLVYANGFFEWRKDGAAKTPMYISLKSGRPFAFAGLWDAWKDPQTGAWRRTFTIVTVEPNPLLAEVHNRMPAILQQGAVDLWLGEADVPALLSVLQPYPADEMRYWPVSKRVNTPRQDDAALIERV